MKILAICGSPRKGNTEFMLKTVLNEITNHEKELVLLREKSIKHCDGCLFCDKNNKCHVKDDDMEELNNKLKEADIIITGSPNYYDNVTGLLKDFIDRTNPFYETDALKGKKVYGLVAGGGSREHSKRVMEIIHIFAKAHNMEFKAGPIAQALDTQSIYDQKELIEELKELGKEIDSL
jgi:multimeric flavodoxin WrbA